MKNGFHVLAIAISELAACATAAQPAGEQR
jgi:hypothetical protein